MQNLKNGLHGLAIGVLWILSFIVSGHIPALTTYLQMPVGTILGIIVSALYVHYGIVQPTIAAAKAGKL